MLLNLQQIRRRIRSVENTKKITRAMEMIAAAKLKRYEKELEKAKRWTEQLESVLFNLTRCVPQMDHPLLNAGNPEAEPTVIVVTSNMGLCGGYNQEILMRAEQVITDLRPARFQLLCVGLFGANYFARQGLIKHSSINDFRPDIVASQINDLMETITQQFLTGQTREVILISTQLISLGNFKPRIKRVLPMERSNYDETGNLDYILEPHAEQLLNELIPACFQNRLKTSLWEAYVAEQMARMMAMRQATKSAQDMIDELILMRNKARQASITKELIEIVTAGRALKANV
jgi:F-type H+-transporting ATPase subunit gamma